MGEPGIFGRGPIFEKVLHRFDAVISKITSEDGAEHMSFPPAMPRSTLEQAEYLDSFPHFAGIVFSFNGTDAKHRELSARIHAHEPWGDLQSMTNVCLTPAACYPVYPACAGTIPAEGRLVDLQSWVFRNEPSPEPTRMQFFRVREIVRIGTPDQVVEYRNLWLSRGLEILKSLGLPAVSDVASDPFFGRGGRMMAANQKEQKLKFEIVVPVISEEKPTALCSFNYHQDHFGSLFGIKTEQGHFAQTACVGFGLERIVMALFKHHGMIVEEWPAQVREVLSL
jgi:seryl-tRNA synthetase